MKKNLIPIIIAAVIVIGGGIAALLINPPPDMSDDISNAEFEIVTGNYYLDGDKNSDMYFELTDDYLALRLENNSYDVIDNFYVKYIEEKMARPLTDEEFKREVGELYGYCEENPYKLFVMGNVCTIMINPNVDENGEITGGTGFSYNGKDTIKCAPFGEFILAE